MPFVVTAVIAITIVLAAAAMARSGAAHRSTGRRRLLARPAGAQPTTGFDVEVEEQARPIPRAPSSPSRRRAERSPKETPSVDSVAGPSDTVVPEVNGKSREEAAEALRGGGVHSRR